MNGRPIKSRILKFELITITMREVDYKVDYSLTKNSSFSVPRAFTINYGIHCNVNNNNGHERCYFWGGCWGCNFYRYSPTNMISTNAIFTKEVFTKKKIPIEMAEKLLMHSPFIPTLDSGINVDIYYFLNFSQALRLSDFENFCRFLKITMMPGVM